MSYAYEQAPAPARAGELGKGNLASAKTTAEKVTGKVKAGEFVALNPTGGVKALSAKKDILAGVVLSSRIRDEWSEGELVDVMHILVQAMRFGSILHQKKRYLVVVKYLY
ncbi:TPA: hypothetical protein ACPPOX_000684 [Haemophilus influenzae]